MSNYSEFVAEVEPILKKYGKNYSDLERELSRLKVKEKKEKIISKIKENYDLVGKCYTYIDNDEKYYIKVISARADNEYSVSCLITPEYPTYVCHTHLRMVPDVGNGIYSDFVLNKQQVTSFLASDLREKNIGLLRTPCEEINPEEFKKSVMKYAGELAKLEFKPVGVEEKV